MSIDTHHKFETWQETVQQEVADSPRKLEQAALASGSTQHTQHDGQSGDAG